MAAAESEAWRENLRVDDTVYVRSASAGGWLLGKITQTAKTRVKVEYIVGTERCDKTLLRSSPDLRPVIQEKPQRPPPPARAAPTGGYVHLPGNIASQAPYPDSAQRRWEQPLPAAPAPAAALNAKVAPAGGQHTVLSSGPPRDRRSSWILTGLREGEAIRVADLEMGDILGSGGFGTVHRGILKGEEVAIKKLHIEVQVEKELIADFIKEFSQLRSMRHPRLIQCLGVAFEPPVICIVTELAARGPLDKLLHSSQAQLDEATRRGLALQIIEGVAFLHSQQPPRVHRDLKSANVVLDADLNAKLCDFGLTESMERTHISRRDGERGSPSYMAPEIWNTRQKLTEKIDVWALGCLVVEVLTNRRPHADCTSLEQVMTKLIVYFGTPYTDDWADHLNAEVPQIVNPCFRHNPAERPTAQGIYDGLSRIQHPLSR